MINLGAGLFFRPHWKVLDYVSPFYPYSWQYIDYNVNLLSTPRFPFEDNSVAYYYSAHVLEHIPQEYCDHLLREIYRTLRPGGAVRLNMPDYERMRRAVAEDDKAYFRTQTERGFSLEEAVVEQIATAMLDCPERASIIEDYHRLDAETFAETYTSKASRAVQKENGGFHINWFTFDKLSGMLSDAGFGAAYRCRPQGSQFEELRGEGGMLTVGDVLEIKRFLGLDTTYPDKSLYVEAVK